VLYIVISGIDVTSQQARAGKPGITSTLDHQFVHDMFYEAGDSWTPPASRPLKSAARIVTTPRDEGLFEKFAFCHCKPHVNI